MSTARTRWLFGLMAVLILGGCTGEDQQAVGLYRAPAIPNTVDGVVFEAGNWEPHLAAGEEGSSWGNHRAVVVVEDPSVEAVTVTIPWRRRDVEPSAKSVVVFDASTGQPVPNALATRIENASGDVIFQPNPGSSTYHVYYMPWHSTGSYYPTITYPDMEPEPDAAWADAVQVAAGLPKARTTHIQSVDDFHSFFPMEVIATPEETAAFMDGSSQAWRLVTEHRDFPVRMRHFIPWHWTTRADTDVLRSRVLRDEAFTFQVVVIAAEEDLADLEVSFDGFPDKWREALTCFNCGGINEKGESFEKDITVPAATVQPLWIGVRIPEDQPVGTVEGTVSVTTANAGSRSVRVELEVLDARATNGGDNEPDLMTRLAWLDSTVGTDPDFIIEPFEPVTFEGLSLSILGRRVKLGATGLPDQILSFFTPVLGIGEEAESILARPIGLEVVTGGETESFQSAEFEIHQSARGRAQWTAESTSNRFSMTVEGGLDYDGMLDYRISLTALADVDVEDIALPIHYETRAATYMLGLGRMGGRRPPSIDWTWAVENHHEGLWLGGMNKGLQYVLRDDNYARPLNTNFYRNQPLRMPPSWFNEGRGGIRIREEADAVVAHNYSGPRILSAGDTLHFNVRFLITPFKPIDTRTHFNTRFVHQYVSVDQVKEWGGTVVNIHHANEINPYINYPFFNLDQQAEYIDEAHDLGIKFKLYYTIRELTYKAHELFALRSLGDEILNDGEGGGHSWLQEHLEDHYHSAWHAFRVDDAAILDKGTSRWTNYYIAGLAWLARNQHIDGLYLDDIAFSRETVKRLVTVLHEHRDEVIIDLHSANQFNERDGFINSAMLYMEHFPYISRLWFGEYFDYDQGPDYWMTEVAGLPFGLMGEMLQDGGHPYRGMLYGMTARKYGEVDPRPVWAMMNDFGIAESNMLGYWLDDAPVQTDHPQVLATTYARPDGVLIALASWSETNEVVDLKVNFEALGLEEGVRAHAPSVEGLQEASEVNLSAVKVGAGMGIFLMLGD
ncbi:MAG: glycoside hydrolase domain-containing protein [Thermoanaerobaculia bacterium]